jgi:bifunctional DNA-binding transcriptional regulator/antitoxin component of YhaV-PrlF toxin-antitoxin module
MSRRRFRRADRSLLRFPRDARIAGIRTRRAPRSATPTEQGGRPAAVILGAQAICPLRATVRLNLRGGLTIPVDIRRSLALESGGYLIVETTAEGLLLRPALTFPLDECDARDAHAALAAADADPAFLKRRRRRMPR